MEKLSDEDYRICRELKDTAQEVYDAYKSTLTQLYQSFGHKPFTRIMVAEAIGLSGSQTAKTLHRMTILNILERAGDRNDGYNYRLLVNPSEESSVFSNAGSADEPAEVYSAQEAQEIEYSKAFYEELEILAASATSARDMRIADSLKKCLRKGFIRAEDYESWGYSLAIWQTDSELAVQLSLISEQTDGSFKLNRDFNPGSPELKPSQKKTVTAIYEAFGDKEFSQEMFIATLNYSSSFMYASLHKLTLMRLIGQKTTEEGNQYQLLVNPQENPEYFTHVA